MWLGHLMADFLILLWLARMLSLGSTPFLFQMSCTKQQHQLPVATSSLKNWVPWTLGLGGAVDRHRGKLMNANRASLPRYPRRSRKDPLSYFLNSQLKNAGLIWSLFVPINSNTMTLRVRVARQYWAHQSLNSCNWEMNYGSFSPAEKMGEENRC